jgi:diguanylate cyclase (GGDEF)-like protein/PAS domain S-box-containing protein
MDKAAASSCTLRARRLAGIALTAAAGLALTMGIFRVVHMQEIETLHRSFESDAYVRSQLVSYEMHHLLSHLKTLRMFIQHTGIPERKGFGALVAPVLAKGGVIQSIQWVPRVDDGQRAGYEREMQSSIGQGSRFTENGPRGDLVGANRREAYFPVWYAEPFKTAGTELGFDYGSVPGILHLLEEAKDAGKDLATHRITLPAGNGDASGIMVVGPVYHTGEPLGTVDERRRALAGFLVCKIRIAEVMEAAIGRFPPMGMPTDLVDLTAPEGERILYHLNPRLQAESTAVQGVLQALSPTAPTYRHSFMFAERELQVSVAASPAYLQRHYGLAHWLVLPAGLALTLILSMYLHVLLTRGQRAEALAQERTAELRVSEQKYRGLFEQDREGLVICDFDGRIIDANQAVLDMTGFPRGEIMGRSFDDFIPARWHETVRDIVRNTLFKKGFADFPESECIRKDGTVFPTSSKAMLLRDESGRARMVTIWFTDITERRRMEEDARTSRQRMESQLRITQLQFPSTQKLLDHALDEVIALTGSRIGYIYHYDDVKQEFTLNSWSREAMRECTVQDRESLTTYQLDKTGIWGEAVRQARPVVVNDFEAPNPLKKGYPEGHAHLKRFLTIPVFRNDRIVAVVGVANKATDYDDADIQQLTLFMNSVWQITERRKAEDELVESRHMLRTVLDAIPVLVYWKDRRMSYLGCNRLLARVAGIASPEEIVGKTDRELVWRARAEQFQAADWEVVESGRPSLEQEELITMPDGRRNWFRTSRIPLQDPHGQVSGVLGVSYDITESKWMDQALRQERDRVQMYLDIARVMIVVLDRSGEITLINRRGCELTGYTEIELLGRNWFEVFVPEEERGPVVGSFRRIIDGELQADRYFENSIVTKTGTRRLIAWNNSAVRDQDGEIIGTLSSGEDITEKRQAEEALHQSRERFKRILEDMPLASSYTDDVGNIEFVNRVFTDIFGYTLEDVPTIEEWFMHAYPDPAYREEVMARWNADATRARQEGTRIGPAEYHITCKDGRERICEITGTFMESGMMAVFTDITERILSAEALRQSEERFRVQFRGIPIPTYIWKGQGDDFSLIDYNDAALEFTRGRIAGFRGVPASVFYEGRPWVLVDMARCLREQTAVKGEFWDTLRTTGEKKYMAVNYAFVPPDFVMVHMEDITVRKEAEEHLRYLSIHDPLTGLYNRFYADTEIQRLKAGRKFPASVIVVDIDGLKAVNDTEGHAAGDLLIKNTAYVLRQTFRPEDMVARTGGDEFLVILPSVDGIVLEQSLRRLRVYLSNFNASNPEWPVSFSIGSSTAHSGEELEGCIKQADMAMYLEKARTKAVQDSQAKGPDRG